MNLSNQQRLTVCKILERHQSHNVSLRSDAYREIQEILKILTLAPTEELFAILSNVNLK